MKKINNFLKHKKEKNKPFFIKICFTIKNSCATIPQLKGDYL